MLFALRRFIPLLILALLFSSCHQSAKNLSKLFSPVNLNTFRVTIDNTKDTVIRTPGGCLLDIPSNAFAGGAFTTITLEIREALKISEMVRAGLLTQSDGHGLSSGGMIEIEASAGEELKMTKDIRIRIPARFIEQGMQLYKGVQSGNGGINWTDPQPLAENDRVTMLESGEQLFKSNCASCHGVAKGITGPALAYISRLRDRKWLYDFTRNNLAVINSNDRYARCLYEQYSSLMNAFPLLTDEQLKSLYNYIDNESQRLGLPLPEDRLKKCSDSCSAYSRMSDSLSRIRNKLIQGNGKGVSLQRQLPKGYVSPDTGGSSKVTISKFTAVYYEFKIQSFGWYNIDIALKNMHGVKNSRLTLRLQGEYAREISVFLIIPAARSFDQGGALDQGENVFGFYDPDGTLPLLQGVSASVMAIGEQNGQPTFGLHSFTTSEKQTLVLEPKPTTREAMNTLIRGLDLKDINMQMQDSKNASAIRMVDASLKDFDRFKPRTCDCNCGLTESDSTSIH